MASWTIWYLGGGQTGEDSFLTVAYLEESSFFFSICEGCTINYNIYEAENVSRPQQPLRSLVLFGQILVRKSRFVKS